MSGEQEIAAAMHDVAGAIRFVAVGVWFIAILAAIHVFGPSK